MRAVVATEPGGPEVLTLVDLPDPVPGPGEVVVAVAATAVNRADLLQRQGHYPPPPGASEIIGLECSGTVAAVGEDVAGWGVGDQVCALLAGGGYAEQVVVPAGQVMPVPDGVDLVTAAALPEVACTVWSNVFMVAGLQPQETLLVHGGGGGIGTMAIQLAHSLGARVVTTAGSAAKVEVCRSLGADVAVNYREQDFVAAVREATDGAGRRRDPGQHGGGVPRTQRGRPGHRGPARRDRHAGRVQGGARPLGLLLRKRAAVIATTLRSRPVGEKAAICAAVVEHVWPLVAQRRVRPIVHGVHPLAEAAAAHRELDDGSHTGKVLLTV